MLDHVSIGVADVGSSKGACDAVPKPLGLSMRRVLGVGLMVFAACSESTSDAPAPHSLGTSFARMLHADGPDPDSEASLGLYSWFIGDWEMDVTTILDDESTHTGRGEIHVGWILQGRAIQDIWMIPRLSDRLPGIEPLPGAGNWYGTTLRMYDPDLKAWRILWNDPATNFFTQQTGRAQGRDIVQEGPDPRGGSMRWTFSEIDAASFHWTGERSPDGRTWRKEVDIRARRM